MSSIFPLPLATHPTPPLLHIGRVCARVPNSLTARTDLVVTPPYQASGGLLTLARPGGKGREDIGARRALAD